ncbi:MAG: tetratricopeptide repeat protein [Casimicrobiaceae bacterium]
MTDTPAGMVTFLFTDIEGSTRLWEQSPAAMGRALARHDALLRHTIESHRGAVFKTVGDAFCAAFATASDAVAAALIAQRAILAEKWPESIPLKVRMALHTGIAEVRDGDYFGQSLNRVGRLVAIAHGSQVLLSASTAAAGASVLPAEASLLDRGSHRLKDLQEPERVFQLCHPELPSLLPPLRSLSAHPNNLPQQLTSFIGREKEMLEVKQTLGRTRLLTITGSGGCGKTRLALHVAVELLEAHSDGVWLVELAALADPELVPQAVAAVFGLSEEAARPLSETLTDYLKSKQLLLVLDNAEHLLAACAQFADTVLRRCPEVKMLVSSREGLGVMGEVSYRVPSLAMPDPKRDTSRASVSRYESVRLFTERAQFHAPQFAVTEQNAAALASICARLDGIPLAIELAAARARSMSVEEVNKRLDQTFRLLTGGSRTALPRQQTLRALIDWSYDLLNTTEQALLWRIAVFAGGWTLDAAERVCADEAIENSSVLDLLTSLVDKSLLLTEERCGVTRYRLLETVRQYARDRLLESGESRRWRNRHLEYFVSLAESAEPHLTGPEQQSWLDQLEREHENLRAALAWCSDEDADIGSGLRLGAAMYQFWFVRGHYAEGRSWLSALLAQPTTDDDRHVRCKALNAAGGLARGQGDYAAASALFNESLAMERELGDLSGVALTLNRMGLLAFDRGDYRSSAELHEQSLAIWREIEDMRGVAGSLNNLGMVASAQGNYATARALYEESLTIKQGLGDRQNVAISLNSLGNIACHQSDFQAARVMYEKSLSIRHELGDREGIATSLNNLGIVATNQGDYARARSLFEESLAIREELGAQPGVASSLNNLGDVACEQGDYANACVLYERSLTIKRQLGDRHGIAMSLDNLGTAVRAQGDNRSARELFEQSLALRRDLGERWGVAVSLNHLGDVAGDEGDFTAGQAMHEESLAIQRELGDRRGIAMALEGLAHVALGKAEPRRASCIWATAQRLREEVGAPLLPSERSRYQSRLAAARLAIGDQGAFDAAWLEGRAMTIEQAVACSLESTR